MAKQNDQNKQENKPSLVSAIKTLESLLEQNRELLDKIDSDDLQQKTPQQALLELPTLIDVVEPRSLESSARTSEQAGLDEVNADIPGVNDILTANLEEIIYNEIRKATNNVQNAILKEVNAQLELTLQALNQVRQPALVNTSEKTNTQSMITPSKTTSPGSVQPDINETAQNTRLKK